MSATPKKFKELEVETGADSDLPEGWALVRIGDVLTLVNGFPFKPTHWKQHGLPIIRIQNLNNPNARFNYCTDQIPDRYLVDEGDLLFAWSGTPGTSFGAHIWHGGKALLNQHIFRVSFDTNLYDKRFLRFSINRNLDEYISQAQGGVGLAHITKRKFDDSFLALPPRTEQARIVARVEGVSGFVQQSRDRLARAAILVKHFRHAVLAAACSGKLTEDWRRVNNVGAQFGAQIEVTSTEELPEGWRRAKAGEFYIDARYGTNMKCEPELRHGTPVLRVPNIARGELDLDRLKYAQFTGHELRNLAVKPGDVLICRTNGSIELIGKAAVIPVLSVPHLFASYLIRVRLDPKALLPTYFHMMLSSPKGRDQIEERARTTAGQFNLNLEILRNIDCPIPALSEQHEIVRRVKALFNLADVIEKRISTATTRAEKLTKAILTKAFRGELVPTEAELARREGRQYEPASVLRERTKADRAAVPKAKKVGSPIPTSRRKHTQN